MSDLTAKVEEIERLLAGADFTEALTVNYTELGPPDDGRLYAFLMEGDPEDGVHVAVDEEPTGADVPSPRLEAIAAGVNLLPTLIADWKRLKEERDVMAALIQTMIDRDPDEIIYIADVGGGALLDEWRNRARKALESSK